MAERLTPIMVVAGLTAVAAALTAIRWIMQTHGRPGELVERGTMGVFTVLLFVPMWIHRKVFDQCHRTLKSGQVGTLEKRPPRVWDGEYRRRGMKDTRPFPLSLPL